MTQSDYVKNELLTLQQQLRPLEERTLGVEKDLREAMAKGRTCLKTVKNHLGIQGASRG